MADFTLVDPKGWEYDLHSVYSAYIGYFQMYNIPWYERSWGHLFESFDAFLVFSWPVITVTDACTGRAHIVTRLNSIGAFLKMIKTRFGETLRQAPNILQVTPFETVNRHLRHVSDYTSYKKLHSTLPAALLSALKTRIRAGDPKTIKELWGKKDKTFMSIAFEWSERNEKSILEWGYAAVRCGHLEALGHWPPAPDTNYRKGHYIVAEYADKFTNKHCPNHPWQYSFGESQVAAKSKLPQIIQAVISSLASPDSETTPNHLVLVGHNIHGDLARLEEMKIKLPHNVLIIDTMVYERALYSAGLRGALMDPKTEKPRASGSSLSFENFLSSLTVPFVPNSPNTEKQPILPQPQPIVLPPCTLHNAGNDAFMCLFALQKLVEPNGTLVPSVKKSRGPKPGMVGSLMINNAATAAGSMMMNGGAPSPNMHYGFAFATMNSPVTSASMPRLPSAYDLASEFGQMQISLPRAASGGVYLTSPGHTRPSEKISKRSNAINFLSEKRV